MFLKVCGLLSLLEEKIQKKLELRCRENSGMKLCVACSSGVDSTVLFHLLQKLRRQGLSFDLAIAHVNFALRGNESVGDETFLKKLAKKQELPFFIHRPEKSVKVLEKKGVQLWARKERYAFFESLQKQGWTVVLAHTQDDLAENILFRMARGTSPLASLGMKEVFGSYWRPLLDTRKNDLILYGRDHGIFWREDISNQESSYARNRLRLEVFPRLEEIAPGASGRLIRFGEESQDLGAFVRESLRKKLEGELLCEEGKWQVPLGFFKGLNKGCVSLILADLLQGFAGAGYVPEHKLLSLLYNWVSEASEPRSKRQLGPDMFCKVVENKLVFTRS